MFVLKILVKLSLNQNLRLININYHPTNDFPINLEDVF